MTGGGITLPKHDHAADDDEIVDEIAALSPAVLFQLTGVLEKFSDLWKRLGDAAAVLEKVGDILTKTLGNGLDEIIGRLAAVIQDSRFFVPVPPVTTAGGGEGSPESDEETAPPAPSDEEETVPPAPSDEGPPAASDEETVPPAPSDEGPPAASDEDVSSTGTSARPDRPRSRWRIR